MQFVKMIESALLVGQNDLADFFVRTASDTGQLVFADGRVTTAVVVPRNDHFMVVYPEE